MATLATYKHWIKWLHCSSRTCPRLHTSMTKLWPSINVSALQLSPTSCRLYRVAKTVTIVRSNCYFTLFYRFFDVIWAKNNVLVVFSTAACCGSTSRCQNVAISSCRHHRLWFVLIFFKNNFCLLSKKIVFSCFDFFCFLFLMFNKWK